MWHASVYGVNWPSTEVANLVGSEDARRVASAEHMPSFVAGILGDLLHEARDKLKMDGFEFIQLDRERALLIDHIGGVSESQKLRCHERIPSTYGGSS